MNNTAQTYYAYENKTTKNETVKKLKKIDLSSEQFVKKN